MSYSLPYVHQGSSSQRALDSVNKTLKHQTQALRYLGEQFQNDVFSQANLVSSLQILYNTSQVNRGKVVVCGIGKSFKIANKLVATLNSLSIHSSALHPSEALHGDLGLIDESRDCLMFLTASGNTPELLQLLPHLSADLPIILLTCNKDSKLSNHPKVNALLYASLPAYLNEDSIHGLPAPTVSATLSLVLADATILALSEMIEEDVVKRKRLFSTKHPGGSIGVNLSHLNDNILVKGDKGVVAVEKKSFSSQVSATSLLSLDQIRRELQLTSSTNSNESKSISSLSSSDDEGDVLEVKVPHQYTGPNTNRVDAQLSNLIRAADKSQILSSTVEEIKTFNSSSSELKLLQWASLYDYITLDVSVSTKLALRTSDLRMLYKILSQNKSTTATDEPGLWSLFNKSLLGSFKEVNV